MDECQIFTRHNAKRYEDRMKTVMSPKGDDQVNYKNSLSSKMITVSWKVWIGKCPKMKNLRNSAVVSVWRAFCVFVVSFPLSMPAQIISFLINLCKEKYFFFGVVCIADFREPLVGSLSIQTLTQYSISSWSDRLRVLRLALVPPPPLEDRWPLLANINRFCRCV